MQDEYIPPKVWTWNKPNGGVFASTNRPIAGATHERALPIGRHPLQLYSLGTPNGVKITILLEELLEKGVVDAEYDAWLIRIKDGDQFGSGFTEINPNSKIPALVDRSGQSPIAVFETGSILLYLAEKFRAFLPSSAPDRAAVLNWLFWQVGSTPYYGGGFAHFFTYAPVKIEYAIDRFAMELKRQLDVLDRQLKGSEFIAGAEYSIADIAIFPWYGTLVTSQTPAAEFLAVQDYQNVVRWAETVASRPAVKRGRLVNKIDADATVPQLHERHSRADFDRFSL